MLDYKMLQYDYSTIAAAGLIAAHQLLGAEFELGGLLALAPFLDLAETSKCVRALLNQHLECSVADKTMGLEHYHPVLQRYQVCA